jgi:transposase
MRQFDSWRFASIHRDARIRFSVYWLSLCSWRLQDLHKGPEHAVVKAVKESRKKFIVKLSSDERAQLERLINKGSSPAKRLLKARILLKADASEVGDGWSNSRIMEALGTNVSMVSRVRKQWAQEGLEAVLSRKTRPARPKYPVSDGGGQTSIKKYMVRLSLDERIHLEMLIKKGKISAMRLLKARILLKADVSEAGEGWSDGQIIEALDTNMSMVTRVRQQLVEEGFASVLSRKERATPARQRIFDGEKEARLIAQACSPAPEGRKRWTLRLLEDKVVELGIVERASDNTIGRVLKKTKSSLIAKNSGSSRQKATPHS